MEVSKMPCTVVPFHARSVKHAVDQLSVEIRRRTAAEPNRAFPSKHSAAQPLLQLYSVPVS